MLDQPKKGNNNIISFTNKQDTLFVYKNKKLFIL